MRIPADICSLCWNTTDSIREEKGEEKKNITDKETGGQTGGQRKTTSTEMNVASSEKSSVTCGFSSERTIKSSGTQAKSSGTRWKTTEKVIEPNYTSILRFFI